MGLEDELKATNEKITDLVRRGDLDGACALYTKDCALGMSNHRIVNQPELKEHLESLKSNVDGKYSDFKVIDIFQMGADHAMMRATFQFDAPNGKQVLTWIVIVYKKDGGQWKIHTRTMGTTEHYE